MAPLLPPWSQPARPGGAFSHCLSGALSVDTITPNPMGWPRPTLTLYIMYDKHVPCPGSVSGLRVPSVIVCWNTPVTYAPMKRMSKLVRCPFYTPSSAVNSWGGGFMRHPPVRSALLPLSTSGCRNPRFLALYIEHLPSVLSALAGTCTQSRTLTLTLTLTLKRTFCAFCSCRYLHTITYPYPNPNPKTYLLCFLLLPVPAHNNVP
jgi:hypothetical protein